MSKNENRKILWPMLIVLGLITANFIGAKYTTLATNLELSNALVIYPFTYLFIVLIARTFDDKYAKKVVYMAAIAQVLFIVGLMLVSIMRSNPASAYDRAYIEYLFTPNNTKALGFTIAYPNLLMYGFSIVSFVLGHLIAVKLYKATSSVTPKVFAFGIGYFLAYIIDTIIFTGGFNAVQMLIDDKFKLVDLVRKLTGQFIGVFVSGIIMIIIFAIICAIVKDNDDSKKEEKEITADDLPEVVKPIVNSEIPVISEINNNISLDDLPSLK